MEADLGKCWCCKLVPGVVPCPRGCRLAIYCSIVCIQRDVFRHMSECANAVRVLICHGCGKRNVALKTCQCCGWVFYCGKTCQRAHWVAYHKERCGQLVKQVLQAAAMRCLAVPAQRCGLPQFIGSSMAEDYLRLQQNEGSNTDRTLKLLFVGVGDIRNVIRTIYELPSDFRGQLNFFLNDVSVHVMARNLLFLYCALVHPTKENAENLVQIWYSLHLTPSCSQFLLLLLQELTAAPSTECLARMKQVVNISTEQWSQCCEVWKGWRRLAKSKNAADRMKQEREKCLAVASKALSGLMLLTRVHHKSSMMDFWHRGVLLPQGSLNCSKAVLVNPTMACFNPFNGRYAFSFKDIDSISPVLQKWGLDVDVNKEMIYCVSPENYVFACWDYLEVKKATNFSHDLISMYKQYLQGVFELMFERIKETKIQFRLLIDDVEQLHKYLPPEEKFDRISLCDLSNSSFLPNQLEKFGSILNQGNEHAILITEFQPWKCSTEHISNFDELAIADGMTRCDILPNVSVHCWEHPYVISRSIHAYDNCYPLLHIKMYADIVAYLHASQKAPLNKATLKMTTDTLRGCSVRMRDYQRKMNRVIPFYREELSRCMSLLDKGKRMVEWLPIATPQMT